MTKPFFNLMMFLAKRKKYNPFRLIFGDFYYTHDIKKIYYNLDTKNIDTK